MKKKIASIAAAALMFVGAAATPAEALTLPPGATTGSSTISGAFGANAPRGTVVNQGDRIMTPVLANLTCTLGYVDRRAGVAYTAGHCGFAGAAIANTRGQIIGYFEASNMLASVYTIPVAYAAEFMPSLRPQVSAGPTADIARIRFVPGVVAGANTFSGDRIVPLQEVRRGDKLCAVGSQSRRVSCGSVDRVNGDATFAFHRGLIPGDSGGPSWIPGKGFVGVTSGTYANMAGMEGAREVFVHPRAI